MTVLDSWVIYCITDALGLQIIEDSTALFLFHYRSIDQEIWNKVLWVFSYGNKLNIQILYKKQFF